MDIPGWTSINKINERWRNSVTEEESTERGQSEENGTTVGLDKWIDFNMSISCLFYLLLTDVLLDNKWNDYKKVYFGYLRKKQQQQQWRELQGQ